jgi:hypothetical protein
MPTCITLSARLCFPLKRATFSYLEHKKDKFNTPFLQEQAFPSQEHQYYSENTCTAITNSRVNGQRKGRSVAGEKEGGRGRKGEGDKNLE